MADEQGDKVEKAEKAGKVTSGVGHKQIDMARRRARVVEMYLQGSYQHEIAEHLGITMRTVRRDLEQVEKEWLDSAITDFARLRLREKAHIDQLERTYWKAWKRSLRVQEETSSQQTTTASGGLTKRAEIKRRQAVGNAEFLAGIRWCVDRRIKLFGLDRQTENEAEGEEAGGILAIGNVDWAVVLGLKKNPLEMLGADLGEVGEQEHAHAREMLPAPVEVARDLTRTPGGAYATD